MVSQVALAKKLARNISLDSKARKDVKIHEAVPQKWKGKSQVEKSSETIVGKKIMVRTYPIFSSLDKNNKKRNLIIQENSSSKNV